MRSLPARLTHSSQASCGPESSGSELAPATPAPQMLQGLLGSDDEEQEDPKDYCKGEALGKRRRGPGARPRDPGGPGRAALCQGRGKAPPPAAFVGSLPQVATTL